MKNKTHRVTTTRQQKMQSEQNEREYKKIYHV